MNRSLCRNPTTFRWVARLWSLGRSIVFGCLFIWFSVVRLFLVYHSAYCSIGCLQLRLFATLFVRDFSPLHNRSRLSLASPSSRLPGLLSNCAQLCITVLDYSWLCQAVIHWFCRAIVYNFGQSVGLLALWPCLCKLFLTIGSLNYKQSKTKSIFK